MNVEPAEVVSVKPLFRLIKIASCPSLSGKSTLTYHIGHATSAEGDSGIYLRIVANSSSGMFSHEWIPFAAIRAEFDKVPAGETITSFLLHALYEGKSVNTPSFMAAALKNEGLIQPAKDKQQQYERLDIAPFLAEVRALIESNVELKWDEPVKASKAKPAAQAEKIGASKPTAKATKASPKSPNVDAETKPGARLDAKPIVKSANGADIAEIVQVINARVPTEAEAIKLTRSIVNDVPSFIPPKTGPTAVPAMDSKKTTAKAGKKSKK